MSRTTRPWLAAACGLVAALAALPAPAASDADLARWRGWIAGMKNDPRGPFDAIRWYCKDGKVRMPTDYACSDKNQD